MSYDNTNRGAAWKNDKRTNEKQPAYRGNLNVEGVEYFVSIWGKKPDANPKSPDISFSIEKKEDALAKQAPAPQNNQFDDDVPF